MTITTRTTHAHRRSRLGGIATFLVAAVVACAALWQRPQFQHYKKEGFGGTDERPPPVTETQVENIGKPSPTNQETDAAVAEAEMAAQEAYAAVAASRPHRTNKEADSAVAQALNAAKEANAAVASGRKR